MQRLDQFNFQNKKALVRVDFNVPLNDQREMTDDTRIKAAVPTIKKILSDGGSVILMSHLGRPKPGDKERFSLRPLVPTLAERLGVPVKFAEDCLGEAAAEMAAQLQAGEVLLLNNLRFYAEETQGDLAFAKKLAEYGEVYVNDAFGTAHRAHASTTQVAQFFQDRVCGYVMQAEIENAQKVLDNPTRPFTAIMGGAKVSDKILIIERLLDQVDCLIIGGGMSYTFSKAIGGQIGDSICENDKLALTQKIVEKAKAKGVKLLLPVDTVIANAFKPDAKTQVVAAGHTPDHWQGLDIGQKTIEDFTQAIESAKTVLWNGPMGVFEFPAFAKGTHAVAESVAKATQKGSFSLIGGGDSAAAINQLGYADQVSYVSTGGGALLEYMEGKTLPGIAALE